MKLPRREVLKGIGGACLALPLLEGVWGKSARGQAPTNEPYVIFFRQGNGVAAEQRTSELGNEPERFWPREPGALTAESVAGRALEELTPHLGKLLVIGNVNMHDFPYGDGHARGALQALTAQGPVVPNAAGDSEASGESLDHRIGRELNPNGRDSLFLYAGQTGGWLGGPCISYRASGVRRSASFRPWDAYQLVIGGGGGLSADAKQALLRRRESLNDLVSDQLKSLLSQSRLSSNDRRRLELHLDSVRDVERHVVCGLDPASETSLEQEGRAMADGDGDAVLRIAQLQMEVAVLAVACGANRSVTLQVGNGNDGDTRYRRLDSGEMMENFHYVSHRRLSHGVDGAIITGSDVLHHEVDRQFARTFRYLLDRLAEYQFDSGSLLDQGMAVWYNDLGNGPAHARTNCPFIVAGSAGGQLRQGTYLQLDGNDRKVENHARLLNTLGGAVGLRAPSGEWISDFGDPSLDRTPLSELLV